VNIEVTPLSPTFGAEVRGVDLNDHLSDTTLQNLGHYYREYRVLLFRGQDLSTDSYVSFARHWGTPRIDVFTEKNVPGYGELMQVGNVGPILSQTTQRNSASFWHTDCAAEKNPDSCTMLYCIKAPHTGGETFLADMQAAYCGLPAELRSKADQLEVRHCYSGTQPIVGGRETWEGRLEPYDEETELNLPKPTLRSLVREHSLTGNKGLYSPAGSICDVMNMDRTEADRLIRRIKLHAISQPYTYGHKYARGDLLMWDNTATMHCAGRVGMVEQAGARLLYRVSPLGLPSMSKVSGLGT